MRGAQPFEIAMLIAQTLQTIQPIRQGQIVKVVIKGRHSGHHAFTLAVTDISPDPALRRKPGKAQPRRKPA